MMNRIDQLLTASHNILSVFYTAGFPTLSSTAEVARSLQAAGADMIEIGIPFSDPIADGPVIQESNKVALENGVSVKKILEDVASMRAEISIPIVLMGYLNPVLQYGMDNFVRDARKAGVDGVIVPDLPLEEYLRQYQNLFEENQLPVIFLVSPNTSEERIRAIDQVSRGFIYAVSSSSTTGAKSDFTHEQELYFQRLNAMKLQNPFLVGFGISNHATFQKASRFSKGAIVGSSFITLLKKSKNLRQDVADFVKELKGTNS